MIRLLTIIAIVLLNFSVQAQDGPSSEASKQKPNEATQKMKQTLERPAPVEDGAKQAPSGEAEPEENWFGCKPDEGEQQDDCEGQTDDRSEKNNDS